jgi:Peptide methionine sulfoxide reductase
VSGCLVDRDPAEPGKEKRAAAEAADTAPGPQHDLLGHVLGFPAIAQQPQYRSAVLVHSADRQVLATASRDAEQQSLIRPIVTQITPASAFYRAEE